MRTKDKRFWAGAGLVTGEMIGTMVIFTGVVASLVYALRPRVKRYRPLDDKTFDIVNHMTGPKTNKAMLKITHLGNHKFLIPANLALIGYFLFVRKRTWFSIRVVAIALSSLCLMLLFKEIFRRKRPDKPLLHEVSGLSFPSGHALMSLTFYGLLMYIVSKTIQDDKIKAPINAALASLILSIGFSRVYLRVHYASDVIAGFIIGFAWLLTSLETIEKLEDFNIKKVKELTASTNLEKAVAAVMPKAIPQVA